MKNIRGRGWDIGRERLWLTVLVAVHIALGLYWGAVIPLFEATDETGHYYHVRYIARHGRLVPAGQTLVDMSDQARQPPFYYILAAGPVSLLDTDDGPAFTPNPYAGWDRAAGGFNAVMHDPAYEAFPWRDEVLAVHVARGVSTLLSALTVWVTFATALRLAPNRPGVRWGAAFALSLWPQFRFSSSVINNDNLVTLSGALMALALAGLLTTKTDRRWRWLVGVGACGILAALSKNNGLPLALAGGLIALGTIIGQARRHPWRTVAVVGGIVGLAAVSVGWWYMRNLAGGQGALALPFMDVWVYQLRRLFAREGIDAGQFFARLVVTGRFAWRSLWAAFGWANIGYPEFSYWLAAGWCLAGLGGLAIRPRYPVGSGSRETVIALALLVAALLLPTWLLYVATGIPHLQGRYLLPALPALVLLVALGWDRLLPQRVQPAFWGAFAGAGLLLAVATPMAVIAPAYAPPRPLEAEQLAEFTPTWARFEDVVELVGYQLDPVRLDAGGELNVKLALRAVQRSDEPLTLAVKAFDEAGHLVGSVHRYPGRGALDTSRWEPDFLFEESITLAIDSAAVGGVGRVEISFYQAESPTSPLTVRDAAGAKLGRSLALLNAFRIGEGQVAALPNVAFRFGAVLASTEPTQTLECAEDGLALHVTWAWQALAEMEAEYRFSLQLRASDNTIVVQEDGPLGDAGVPTPLWSVGEVMPQQTTLKFVGRPSTAPLSLYLAVYEPTSGARLPLRNAEGQATGQDELFLGSLTTEELSTICGSGQ